MLRIPKQKVEQKDLHRRQREIRRKALLDEKSFAQLVGPTKVLEERICGTDRKSPGFEKRVAERTGRRTGLVPGSARPSRGNDETFPACGRGNGENHAASRTSEVSRGQVRHQLGIEIIENVPQEHGVKRAFGVL